MAAMPAKVGIRTRRHAPEAPGWQRFAAALWFHRIRSSER